FCIMLVASAGVPLPVTLLLILAGSFTNQGELKLWQVLVGGSAGGLSGDQIGFALSRWGGHRVVNLITGPVRGPEPVKQAEEVARKWGGPGIFFSRWLVTPLGPWLNLTSGIASYPWPRFVFWDALGEIVWVVLYVLLGYFFNDRVQEIAMLMGDLSWV